MNNNTHTIETLIQENSHNFTPDYNDFLLVLTMTQKKIHLKQESPYLKYFTVHTIWVRGIASVAVFGVLAFTVMTPQIAITPNEDTTFQMINSDTVTTDTDIFMSDLGGFADEVSFIDDQINSDELIDLQERRGSYFQKVSSYA